ncbi:hypothetical protein [Stappia sp.]|uniref:hypothetical protein n=1 Tax=Stappia sp. TaxID=1870903 RepID=UPI0032D935A3
MPAGSALAHAGIRNSLRSDRGFAGRLTARRPPLGTIGPPALLATATFRSLDRSGFRVAWRVSRCAGIFCTRAMVVPRPFGGRFVAGGPSVGGAPFEGDSPGLGFAGHVVARACLGRAVFLRAICLVAIILGAIFRRPRRGGVPLLASAPPRIFSVAGALPGALPVSAARTLMCLLPLALARAHAVTRAVRSAGGPFPRGGVLGRSRRMAHLGAGNRLIQSRAV